jgi:hypothetical protein
MAVEPDAHHVEGLPLVPVGGRPNRHDAGDALAVLEPHLDADGGRSPADCQQVVVDGEPGRLRIRRSRVALRAQRVDVAAGRGAVVAGDLARAPAEVVDGRDVGEEVEALLVAEVRAGLDDPGRIDDERRLAVRVLALDEPGNPFEGQLATPRISYAGGTPALIFSWSRTMPSSSASGLGGHPGTWMSTGTILSTPWRIA